MRKKYRLKLILPPFKPTVVKLSVFIYFLMISDLGSILTVVGVDEVTWAQGHKILS